MVYGASLETQRCSQASNFGLVKMYVRVIISPDCELVILETLADF